LQLLRRQPDSTLQEDGDRPLFDDLDAGGDPQATLFTKIKMLCEIGWPESARHLKDNRGRRLIVRPDRKKPVIWELKAKPSCWRVFFHVYEASEKILFLHAVCKKKNAQDRGAVATARARLRRVGPGAGDFGAERLEFPS
jgi:hypothetical protein